MHTSRIAPILLFVIPSLAQSLGSLPTCAQSCLTGSNTPKSACSATDIKCLCNDKTYIEGIGCCIFDQCPSSDVSNAIKFATQICSSGQVDLSSRPSSCPQSSSSGSSAAPSRTTSSVASTSSQSQPSSTEQGPSSTSQMVAASSAAAGAIIGFQWQYMLAAGPVIWAAWN